MKDYTELSDFEINKMITQALNIPGLISDGKKKCYKKLEVDAIDEFNPCNNWSDAGPIIVENKMSIHHSIIKYDVTSLVYNEKYANGFKVFCHASDIGDTSSHGALRAAMIVFLMMKGGK